MNPLSKFCIFLVLAGILAVLFAFVPGHRTSVPDPKQDHPAAPAESAAGPARKLPAQQADLGMTGEGAVSVQMARRTINGPAEIKIPAIRGGNDYGWVQLPYGTPVELVRATHNGIWIRWDETVVKIPQSIVESGAVVVRRPALDISKS